MFTYCLFCETAKCDSVADSAQKLFHCRAIYPKRMQHTWSKGKMVDIAHALLPGYVFLYVEDQQLPVASLHSIQGVIRCLADQDQCYELSGTNEQFAMMLLRKDGIIGKTKVFREGQLIHICEGAYKGVESRILKVDHRNMRMQIVIPFANLEIKTWVEYEIVERNEPDEGAIILSGKTAEID